MNDENNHDETNDTELDNQPAPVAELGDEWVVIASEQKDSALWDFLENPILEGVVQSKEAKHIKNPPPGRTENLFIIKVGDEDFAVFQSAKLKEWGEQTFVGQHVRIEYKGKKDIGHGRTMKDFTVMVKKGQ